MYIQHIKIAVTENPCFYIQANHFLSTCYLIPGPLQHLQILDLLSQVIDQVVDFRDPFSVPLHLLLVVDLLDGRLHPVVDSRHYVILLIVYF